MFFIYYQNGIGFISEAGKHQKVSIAGWNLKRTRGVGPAGRAGGSILNGYLSKADPGMQFKNAA